MGPNRKQAEKKNNPRNLKDLFLARLRADLNTFFAKLYGLTEELRYILDPKTSLASTFEEKFLKFWRKN